MANIITQTFIYKLADDYLAQTGVLGKTAEWTYIGPDEVCLVIDSETNRYAGKFLTHDHDKDNVPEASHQYHVHVDCSTNPLLCALAHTEIEKPDYADLEQHEELLPDGLTYKRPLHPPPDHTHDIGDIEFDPNTKEAPFPSTFPWKKPHSTWNDLRYWRNALLDGSDDKEGDHLDDMPQSLKDAWIAHRQLLRDLPQLHGASNTHIFVDLTATAPLNTVGQTFIKVSDVTDINVGDDVGVKGWPVVDIFTEHTTVVSINAVDKIVELSDPLVSAPTDANSEIAFSPCPITHPHKVGAHTSPNGEGGVDGDLGPGPVGSISVKHW